MRRQPGAMGAETPQGVIPGEGEGEQAALVVVRAPPRHCTAASLPDLPWDVLESIAELLPLKDRVALTSSMPHALACSLSSDALWGDLDLSLGGAAADRVCAAHALPAWLARRRGALRHLALGGGQLDAAVLLGALRGAPALRQLAIRQVAVVPRKADAHSAFSPVAGLRSLTRLELSDCLLARLPDSLTALAGTLVDLGLSVNMHLGEAGAGGAAGEALAPLAALTNLTRLDMRECGLEVLPPQLEAMPRLAALELSYNWALASGGAAAFAPLAHLRSLTRLDLSRCWLHALPPQLAALAGSLENLDLAQSLNLGRGGPAALEPLAHLSSLTRLNLSSCNLASPPPQLANLCRLADLDLTCNRQLVAGGDHVLEPLAAVTALTRLDLTMCRLERVPSQVSALHRLALLDLGENEALGWGSDEAFAPLEHAGSLTRLRLGYCGLRALPRQLGALSALRELDLSRNKPLGEGGEAGFAPLAALAGAAALTRLELARCGLRGVPRALGALGGCLADLDISHNSHLGEDLAPLQRLTALQRLDVTGCGLRGMPSPLAVATAAAGAAGLIVRS